MDSEGKMRVLITGGAGYLGSVLTRKLLQNGYEALVLDNFLYGHESLANVKTDSNLQIIEGDIRNLTTVSKALRNVDAVIHLASIVGDQAGNLDHKSTVIINYLATQALAEMSTLYGIQKFIFASTCSVYGDAPNHAMREIDLNPKESPETSFASAKLPKPISLYGETKLKSEMAIRRVSGLNSTIFRLGTLFGMSARMRFDLAINLFVAKAMNKEKLTVFGGQQYRPFLHVQDAADAFINGLEGDSHGVFNVAWGNFKIIDVAQIVSNRLGAEIEVSDEIVDERNYIVSTEKMRELGIEPERTIDDAIIEIKEAFNNGLIKNYASNKYSNYKSLFSSKRLQRKVYLLGPIGERI